MKRISTLFSHVRLGLVPQLIGLIVLVAIASGGLVGIELLHTSRNALRDEIFRKNISQADLAADFISNYISAVRAGLRSFAAQPDLVQAVLADSPEQMQAELDKLTQTQPALDGASLYDAKGILRVTGNPNKQSIGASFADREWFQGALASREPFFGIPVLSRVSDHPIVPFGIPILDAQGRVRGVLGAAISLETLSDSILATPSASDLRTSLVDLRSGGLILADPDPTRILAPVSSRDEAARHLLAGERGALETTDTTGESDLAVYSPIPDLPWGILILQPADTVFAPIDDMSNQAFLITSLSILLAILVGVSSALRVTRPVIQLRDAARRLTAGKQTHALGFTQRDEIGDLGRAFDEMAGVLSEKQVQLSTNAARLERSIRDLKNEIAERQRAEQALSESEQRQRSLFENMRDGFAYSKILFDEQDRPVDSLFLQANPAFERLTGLQDVVGKKAGDLMPWMNKTHPQIFESCVRVALTGQPEEYEFCLKPLDRWLSVSAYSYNKGYFASVFADITKRKQAELAWAEQRNLLRTVIDNLPDKVFAKDRNGAFILANASHAAFVGTTTDGMLGKTDDDLYQPNIAQHFRATDLEVLQSGQALYDDETVSEDYIGNKHWVLVTKVPLLDGRGNCIGIVGVSRDITERKRAEEELAEQHHILRILIDNLPATIYVKDTASRMLLANSTQAHLLGVQNAEDLIGKTDLDYYPKEFADKFMADERAIFASGQALLDYEEPVVDAAGNTRWYLSTKVPFLDSQGKVKGIVGIGRDITERKQAEEALVESNARFRALFDSSPDAILLVDPRGNWPILDCNEVACRMNGYSRDELIGQSIDLLNLTRGNPTERTKYLEQIRQSDIVHLETNHRRKDGTEFPIETSTSLITLGGRAVVLGIDRDITQRKRMEEELTKFRLGIERADDAIFMTDLDGTIVYVNPAFEKTYGYTRNEAIGQTPRIIKSGQVTPETYRHFWGRLLSKESVAGELVNKTKDGRLLNIEGSANPILDEKGTPVGYLGVQRDITRRKQGEEKLRREVEKLNALHDVDRALASTLDLNDCLNIIVNRVRSLFADSSVALMLREGERLRMVAQAGVASAASEIVIPLTGSLTGWSYTHRASVFVPDVLTDERYMLFDSRTRAEMAAPLLVQEECIGVLNVEGDQVGAFTPADLDLLESIAGRAAAAIHNARLLKAEREQRQFSDTLRDFGLALASQRDPDIVLDQLLDQVARVVPYDSAAVVLLEGGILRNKRQRGYERFGKADWLSKLEVPLEELNNFHQMAVTRRPYLVDDAWNDPNWVVVDGMRYIRSWVGAPIHVNGAVLGFLSLDKVEPGYYTAEMAERLAAFATQAGLALDNARLYARQQELAVTDGLTGIFNRRHFMELAEREYAYARRHKTDLTALMIDLDHFKQVNDRYGHAVGDLALQIVAKGLASTVRSIDVVARYGGDEFVVLLPGCGRSAAHLIVERLKEGIKAWTVPTEEGPLALSLSIGTAVLNGDEDLDYILARADADMYVAKGQLKRAAAAEQALAG